MTPVKLRGGASGTFFQEVLPLVDAHAVSVEESELGLYHNLLECMLFQPGTPVNAHAHIHTCTNSGGETQLTGVYP